MNISFQRNLDDYCQKNEAKIQSNNKMHFCCRTLYEVKGSGLRNTLTIEVFSLKFIFLFQIPVLHGVMIFERKNKMLIFFVLPVRIPYPILNKSSLMRALWQSMIYQIYTQRGGVICISRLRVRLHSK